MDEKSDGGQSAAGNQDRDEGYMEQQSPPRQGDTALATRGSPSRRHKAQDMAVCLRIVWPVGLMDKVSASGARHSSFEYWVGHYMRAFRDEMAIPSHGHIRQYTQDRRLNMDMITKR